MIPKILDIGPTQWFKENYPELTLIKFETLKSEYGGIKGYKFYWKR